MAYMQKAFIKCITSILLAIIILVLSLSDSLGRASSFFTPKKEPEAVFQLAAGVPSMLLYSLAAAGITIATYEGLQAVGKAIDDSGILEREDWKKASAYGLEGGFFQLTPSMVEDVKGFINGLTADGAHTIAGSDSFNTNYTLPTVYKVQTAGSALDFIDTDAAILVGQEGFSPSFKKIKRFIYAYDNGLNIQVATLPDNIRGFIINGSGSYAVYNDGTLTGSLNSIPLAASYLISYNTSNKSYSNGGSISFDADQYFPFYSSGSFTVDAKGHYIMWSGKSYGTSYHPCYLVGYEIWSSMEAYQNGEASVESYPGYGAYNIIDLSLAGESAGALSDIIGIDLPFDDAAAGALIDAAGAAAEKARAEAGENEDADSKAAAAAAAVITGAIADLKNDMNSGNAGIIGVLKSILAALTTSGLYTLLKNYIADVKSGSIFTSIIQAIEAVPSGVISSVTALPDQIGNVMKTVLTGLGLDQVFGKAIDSALDWVRDIPGSLAGAIEGALVGVTDIPGSISHALDWIMDIPGSISDAISKGLDWVMDLPGSISDAISKGLDWVTDLPANIADAIQSILDILLDLVLSIPGIDFIIDWLLLDVNAVLLALAGAKAIVLEKVGLPEINPFFGVLNGMAVKYPVVKFDTPKVLKPFYNHAVIILIDFSDYQVYCQNCRSILQALLWFSFLIYLIKSQKVVLSLG